MRKLILIFGAEKLGLCLQLGIGVHFVCSLVELVWFHLFRLVITSADVSSFNSIQFHWLYMQYSQQCFCSYCCCCCCSFKKVLWLLKNVEIVKSGLAMALFAQVWLPSLLALCGHNFKPSYTAAILQPVPRKIISQIWGSIELDWRNKRNSTSPNDANQMTLIRYVIALICVHYTSSSMLLELMAQIAR